MDDARADSPRTRTTRRDRELCFYLNARDFAAASRLAIAGGRTFSDLLRSRVRRTMTGEEAVSSGLTEVLGARCRVHVRFSSNELSHLRALADLHGTSIAAVLPWLI